MNGNYIRNKLLFRLGIYAVLLGLVNQSVLAQQRKPTAAEIQKAQASLRQRIQSLKNSGRADYIKDYRNPDLIQERDELVNAWQKVNPEITPFLGVWVNYEEAWGIHPSNKPGSVCLIKTQPEGLSIEIGTVANNSIYTNKGKVFIKEGDYLGFGTIKNDRLDFTTMGGILLNSAIKLQNPYAFESIDGKPASPKVLKSYAQAGCTASEPSNNIASNSNSLSTLPSQELVNAIRKHTINPNYSNVEYSFFEIDLNGDRNKDAIVYETGSHCGQVNCYLSIFLKTGKKYQHLGTDKYILQTFNSKVAILKDSHSGWIDLAMPAFSFNPSEYDKVKGWKTYQFNGKEYTSIDGV